MSLRQYPETFVPDILCRVLVSVIGGSNPPLSTNLCEWLMQMPRYEITRLRGDTTLWGVTFIGQDERGEFRDMVGMVNARTVRDGVSVVGDADYVVWLALTHEAGPVPLIPNDGFAVYCEGREVRNKS